MEDLVRYFVLGLGAFYAINSIRQVIFKKNYACSSCSSKDGCGKKTCDTDDITLSKVDKDKINKIKLSLNKA